MKKNNTTSVNIKLLPEDFFLYGHPCILMMSPQKAYRAIYGERLLEIQKMLRGIVESIIALENMMNNTHDGKRLFLEENEITISNEQRYWMYIYLMDNAILRIFACLEKIAQMCRCYLEYKNNSTIFVTKKCGCSEELSENNCTFGTLLSLGKKEKELLDKEVFILLQNLNKNKSIEQLRPFRNSFLHKKHHIDSSIGIEARVSIDKSELSEQVSFGFGNHLPTFNWFRVELVGANNGIIDFLESIGNIMFPQDFEMPKTTISKQ